MHKRAAHARSTIMPKGIIMTRIIDRRLNGKNKSAVNRERFLRRFRSQIKQAVNRALKNRSITEVEHGEKISIPVKDIAEPSFGHGRGGVWEHVHPGNEEYRRGDKINRPNGGGQGKGKNASQENNNEDDFVFELTKEEFLHIFFDDLALPNLIKTQLASIKEQQTTRAGFSTDGTPNNIHIIRSLKSAMGRRIALGAPLRQALQQTQEAYEQACAQQAAVTTLRLLEEKIQQLKQRLEKIPYLDPFDLRYINRVKQPKPTAKAVMFCIMDVSGSMDEAKKEMAKRFFILLYLFLLRNYDKIDVVFIRHHTQAQEVNEQDFFYSRETGGTVVSSALHLLHEVINQRYPLGDWNLYVAQASDGDNWESDSPLCHRIMAEKLLPIVQYYAYIEITEGSEQSLWHQC